jgi:hypothetical protein
MTLKEIEELVGKYFLLQDYYKDEKLPFKLAMYGVTLFQNGLNDYLKDDYYGNLKWLYENATFCKTRENSSANMNGVLRNDFDTNYLGVDCALLNTKKELLSLPQLNPKEFTVYKDNIGVFFGRSTKKTSRISNIKFLNKISKKLNKELVNIPWNYFSGGLLGDSLGKYKLGLSNYHNFKNVRFKAGDVMKGLSDLSLVITDTYHVAINSIALGVPVICIYETSPAVTRDANMGHRYAWRDKRALLFLNNNLSDFLINSDDLRDSSIREEKIDNICSLLAKDSLVEMAYKGIHAIAENDRKKIGEMLLSMTKEG